LPDIKNLLLVLFLIVTPSRRGFTCPVFKKTFVRGPSGMKGKQVLQEAGWIRPFQKETAKPVILTEYAHAPGLSAGNLKFAKPDS
jgi:hypothetical protein